MNGSFRRVVATLLFRDPQGRQGAITLGDAPIEIGDPTARARVALVDHEYRATALGPGVVTLNGIPLVDKALRTRDVLVCGALTFDYLEELEADAPPFGAPSYPSTASPTMPGSGSYISTPTGPDASPPGWKPDR